MAYVYSTKTNDIKFDFYYPSSVNEVPLPYQSILIRGGTGLAGDYSGKDNFTPRGAIMTEVSDSDLELLMTHNLFRKFMDSGTVYVSKVKKDGEQIFSSKDMKMDGCRQLVDSDFKTGEINGIRREAPVVN